MYTVIVGALLGLIIGFIRFRQDDGMFGAILFGIGGGMIGVFVILVISSLVPTHPVQIGSDTLVGISTNGGSLQATFVSVNRNQVDGTIAYTVCVQNQDGTVSLRNLSPDHTVINDKGNPQGGGQLLTYEYVCVSPWDKWTFAQSPTYELRVPPGSIGGEARWALG